MIASFKLTIDELDNLFIEKLKQMFNNNKIIEIHISEEMYEDETDYLLSSSANRESLFRSLQQLDNNEVIIKQINEIEQ